MSDKKVTRIGMPVVFYCGARQEGDDSDKPCPDKCPKCGGKLEHGFGLAFGGYGVYAACDSKGCDFFWKRQVDE